MADTPVIYILNGPNLNLLGMREPDIYGHDTLDDIAARLDDQAQAAGCEIEFRQSNHEGHLCDWLQEAAAEGAKAVLINAGALTHTSLALYDCIRSVNIPVIEVHISNPIAREEFRHHSYVGMAAIGTISGFGSKSYELALAAALHL